ncbi:MAG TPA: HNH endonuclease signature motif containing protein [Chthonomonadaceae bacterium]|nr:HNH endonuclease signature motif containing protein [Chthonomonadaceae bacterium]
MAHESHDRVRELYGGRCGYCGISETDAGGQLTVDHFRPRSAGGTDDLQNLVYACFRCNLFKSDYWPNNTDPGPDQFRVLNPARDKVDSHIQLDENTGLLVPLTERGRFHIQLLQLNRPELITFRRNRRIVDLKTELLAQLERENELQRTINDKLRSIIANLLD